MKSNDADDDEKEKKKDARKIKKNDVYTIGNNENKKKRC
jgi:hypothetical protein